MNGKMANNTIALLVVYLCAKRIKEKEKRKKRIWMKERWKKRNSPSHMKLLRNTELTTSDDYKNVICMDLSTYMELLDAITPLIKKKDTAMRGAISSDDRLSATLRFLATGGSYEDLKFITNISAESLRHIIIETCEAIISILEQYIQIPKNANEWKAIAAEFEKKWNFYNCIGAIDGKHINILKPTKPSSYYYNYKNHYSIVMMAVVNANCEFMIVEVGINGKVPDEGVFEKSKLNQQYKKKMLNLPKSEKLELSEGALPYVLVGDNAFPLLENLMKPYSNEYLTREKETFNNRLSKARQVADNAFGVLASRFRILNTSINLCPDKASTIALTCCYLHNYLKKNSSLYLKNFNDHKNGRVSETRVNQLTGLEPMKCDYASVNAKYIRNKFSNYFNSVSAVD